MSEKTIQLANFNVVFFKERYSDELLNPLNTASEESYLQNEFTSYEEFPLLTYFDTVFMPAITANIQRVAGKRTRYFFQNIQVVKEGTEYVVKGKIIKDTVLVVQSVLNNESGELEPSDQEVRSSPYSVFVIFLRNHRMTYVRNQQGSPTLVNFESLIRLCLDDYISKTNAKMQKESEKDEGINFLPNANVNIEGLPVEEQKIKDILNKVDRINSFTLKFYPLNGDVDLSPQLNGALRELRQKVISKNGSITLASPKSKDGIAEFIAESEGTFHPVLRVTYPDNTKQKITDTEIMERRPCIFETESISEDDLLRESSSIERLKKVSPENDEVYQLNKGKINSFIEF